MSDDSIAIVGAGPAGLAATLQLRRYGLCPHLYEQSEPGGLLLNADRVENYPGFPTPISGPKLVDRMLRQLDTWQPDLRWERVDEVDWQGQRFRVRTARRVESYQTLLLATGTRPVGLPKGLIDPAARSEVYHEVRPLRDLSDSAVSIIGAGDAAFDYALQLAGRGNRVRIHVRSTRPRALPLLVDRAREHPGIQLILNSVLTHATREDGGTLRLGWDTAGQSERESADVLLVAIGRVPELSCVSEVLLGKREALIEAGHLHIMGDLGNDRHRQASIAVADGIRAAMRIWEQRERQG